MLCMAIIEITVDFINNRAIRIIGCYKPFSRELCVHHHHSFNTSEKHFRMKMFFSPLGFCQLMKLLGRKIYFIFVMLLVNVKRENYKTSTERARTRNKNSSDDESSAMILTISLSSFLGSTMRNIREKIPSSDVVACLLNLTNFGDGWQQIWASAGLM